jgi:signal transduction histidine kinase
VIVPAEDDRAASGDFSRAVATLRAFWGRVRELPPGRADLLLAAAFLLECNVELTFADAPTARVAAARGLTVAMACGVAARRRARSRRRRLIAGTGRDAIVELRRLLGVLHVDEGPLPTLDGLDTLVDRARAAGLPVALTIEGERRALPAGVELAAYRVIQEAITNAIKYAGAAPTDVRVLYGADDVQLHVRDRGPGRGAPHAVGGGGHGLVGMRERVRVFGGEVHTGRCDGGGFEVRARIPVEGVS